MAKTKSLDFGSDKKMSVNIKEKNESSSCMLFMVSVMLLSLTLLTVLPPVLNRHRFKDNNPEEMGNENEGDITGDRVTGYVAKTKEDNAHDIPIVHKVTVTPPATTTTTATTTTSTTSTTSTTTTPTTTTSTTTTSTRSTTSTTTAVPRDKEEDTAVFHTQFGSVRGVEKDGVRIFHGVPYAQPPVGDLRWQAPVELKPWSPKEYDATWPRPGCPQICKESFYCPHNTSEDCLYMEIYTPLEASQKTSLLPVLFYIHGGSFKDMSSTSPIFDVTKFVQVAGVIAVFVEYRLGALGFLVTGEGEGQAHGNYGILDQQAALSWVKDNIEDFGGDHEKITLAGQSAGAQSVLIHLMSEDTSQLFKNVIVESPPLTLPFKTTEKAELRGFKLADRLFCVDDNDVIDMDCLRRKEVKDIVKVQHSVSLGVSNYLEKAETWGPVVDGNILKTQIMKGLEEYSKTRRTAKPIIWGLNSEEAVLFAFQWFNKPTSSFTYYIGTSMLFSKKPSNFKKLYPAKHSDTREDMALLATDFLFRCPGRKSIRDMAAHGDDNVWAYTWNHALDAPVPSDFALFQGRVCHGMEIPFIFRSFSALNVTPSDTDLLLSDKVIAFYKNFIQFSNPNGPSRKKSHTSKNSDAQLPYWPAVSKRLEKSYSQLVFQQDGSVETVKRTEDKGCDMWDERGYFLR